ncbi:MAG: respiratory nitrate reductase subunit gamma [Candidatus Nanopelagicales bacterium]|jgi:nitrate reductase gamma subunit|nr:respiratory nitrate reductase subunit gamma [Actinomycetes bacterium]MCU0301198.1 respiratory nitrate reductase subunit gamma [Candidatus Nanopelagicales bacterium]
MSTADILLWVALPYATIATFVVGTIWRYRYDKFGWTTRSSQLYERRLIRIASPLFHIGILAVLVGHVVGLVIPESWTEALGVSESLYHAMAVALGLFAGAATLVGIVLLIYRRRTVGPVFAATTRNDKTMYVFLGAAIALGLLTTLVGAGVLGEGHNYREDVSVWFRSILLFQPQPELMAEAPLSFRVHAVAGMLVFVIWPFTRLVHAFSAPLGYLFRPYVVYRDRGPHDPGSRAARPGWERIGQ